MITGALFFVMFVWLCFLTIDSYAGMKLRWAIRRTIESHTRELEEIEKDLTRLRVRIASLERIIEIEKGKKW